jgi:hypothetical protein
MQHISGRPVITKINYCNDEFQYKSYMRRKISSLCAETIISPFDSSSGKVAAATTDRDDDDDDNDDYELALTRENVELVLDEMRPFLQADG